MLNNSGFCTFSHRKRVVTLEKSKRIDTVSLSSVINRQCVETIRKEPKLKCYQIGGAETTLIIVAIRRDNYLQDFNMAKI